jgi:hypothetical protein
MFEHKSSPLLPRHRFIRRQVRHTAIAGGLVAVSLLVGMAGYMGLAHMSWPDAFLNSAMLLGGMGPVGDLPNTVSKVFAGLFALYAGVIFIVSAGILVAPAAHRVLHRLHLEERREERRSK